jgi:NAD(P)-dependent dehydrogenase (short-subunit alcohol dehydrogenase family)
MEIRLDGEVAAVTGGGGILCGSMAKALARAGAKVAVLDLRQQAAGTVVDAIRASGGQAASFACDVGKRESLEEAAARIEEALGGPPTILVNGAGGNKRDATTAPGQEFFDLPIEAFRAVLDLNLLGTVLPSQVFGRRMAKLGQGNIVNISSMNALRPLTKIPAYSAAKAAVTNFTQWLAVHMCQNYSKAIRVNAIAPGFFLTDQNRFLLTDEKGGLTDRGRQIMDHTPMGRFGEADDLLGTLLWLVGPASAFVTGIVVPVDGGFSAYSGV